MSKNTIFGEENFIIKDMVTEINNKLGNVIIDNLTNTIKYVLPEIQINHEKVKRWAMLCSRLENIEETELVNMATKKKITDLKDELAQQKAMWQKLKEWIEKDHDWNLERGNNDCALGQRWVLDKMQELEKGEKDVED